MGGTFDPKKLLDELSSNQSILELIFDISSKGPKVNQVIKALGPKVVQNIGALHILNVLDNPEYYSKYNSGSNSEQGELEVGEACQRAIFYPEFKTTGKAHLRTYGKEVSPAAIYIGDRILVSCNTIKLPRKIKKRVNGYLIWNQVTGEEIEACYKGVRLEEERLDPKTDSAVYKIPAHKVTSHRDLVSHGLNLKEFPLKTRIPELGEEVSCIDHDQRGKVAQSKEVTNIGDLTIIRQTQIKFPSSTHIRSSYPIISSSSDPRLLGISSFGKGPDSAYFSDIVNFF